MSGRGFLVLPLVTLLLFQVLSPVYAASHYTTKTVLVSGLNKPMVIGKDSQGRIYLTNNDGQNLLVFVPGTSTVYSLYVSSGRITDLEYDFYGWIYFKESLPSGDRIMRCKVVWIYIPIPPINLLACISQMSIYNAPSGWMITDYDVVPFTGDVVISLLKTSGTPPFETSVVRRTPSGVVSTLESYSSPDPISITAVEGKLSISIVWFPTINIQFRIDVAYILNDASTKSTNIMRKLGNSPAQVLLTRYSDPLTVSAAFAYIEVPGGIGNTIYYVYRSINKSLSIFGNTTLEIGKIQNAFSGSPSNQVLFSWMFYNTQIMYWFGFNDGMIGLYPDITTAGNFEVFTSLIFYDGTNYEYRLMRFYGNPMQMQIVESAILTPPAVEYYAFTLLSNGDLVYARRSTGEIIRAIR